MHLPKKTTTTDNKNDVVEQLAESRELYCVYLLSVLFLDCMSVRLIADRIYSIYRSDKIEETRCFCATAGRILNSLTTFVDKSRRLM